jgi:hypothetical protein
MDEVDRPHLRGRVEPPLTPYGIVWLVLLGLLAALLWSFAVWTAYAPKGLWEGHVTVPKARRLVADFQMRIDPVSRVALEHGGLALPALACAGLVLAWWTKSRWAWRFVLVGLPLLAGAALSLISHHYVSKLLEALST